MEGKVAIVTGAAGGIGEAIVRKLGEKGVKVLGTGRNAGKLGALKDRLGDSMAFDFVAVDATADDAPRKIVDGAIVAFGRLDIVVNNAGSFNFGPVDQTTDAMLDEVLGISLRAPFRLCREALAHIGHGGAFVFIGSTWGIYGTPGGGAYSVVKAGQIGLTQTMAAEYGAKGIRTNYVAPTVVRTEMTDAYWDLDFFRRTNHELTPSDRECTVEDVASMVAFLCSDEAGFVNGQTIAVDGGISTTRYLSPVAIGAERK
ncbi:SDR family NAD(P)-dependent oxidoreductase [Novosphingobium album (ex Liu et al. 2023)]|uniref:SDR family NAD(P)-dependent oxidoreductase n=1 Tax=Novosphingobium album (ex Liu et al. 2023) TaxID=3031130 RepID=A0ABT5WLY3_9SPHN|nr:SDR family oxidoreductase [Novosphingobium album (ex Liu et al. 2023)]MDE8651052.1 SDR family NAD(P)-dependent oxidoreductase [Novosphingobium album (ex Liu et al. 2023)]